MMNLYESCCCYKIHKESVRDKMFGDKLIKSMQRLPIEKSPV